MKNSIMLFFLFSLCSCSSFDDLKRSMYIDKWTETDKMIRAEQIGYEQSLRWKDRNFKGPIGYRIKLEQGGESQWSWSASKKDMPNLRYRGKNSSMFFN